MLQLLLNEKFDLIVRKQERTIGAVEKLGNAMNIPAPIRIEAFDNSNIMGTNLFLRWLCLLTDGQLK